MSRDVRAADWLPLMEALRRVVADAAPLMPEEATLEELTGRVLAEDVASPVDHPPWDNSAMDGFAVRAEDVQGASAQQPVTLRVVADIPAGTLPTRAIGAGEAAKIMTGAPVPAGADSVIRIEHTDAWESDLWSRGVQDRIAVLESGDAGRNVRRRGEDMREGAGVLRAGQLIRPGEVGVLASLGRTRARTHRRPVVALLSNGDELVEPTEIEAVRAGRGIVNSNAYGLAAAVREAGGIPRQLGIARDDEADILRRLEPGLDADVLVTSAGAAVGEHDLVKRVLDGLGFELDFWRVRVRPGSPFSYGRIPRADADRPPLRVFGLPGNPVSALVTFHMLVRPPLLRMLGHRHVLPTVVRVRVAEAVKASPGKTQLMRAHLTREDGDWVARLTGPQGSGILTSMVQADALLVVPEESRGVAAGARLWAIPLRPPEAWGEPLREQMT